MAIVATNIIIDGLSGKLGRSLVFRTLHGKTFVSQAARKPDKKKETPAQRETRSNFREATEWARTILRDPEKKAYYKQRARVLKLPNAYTAAITAYMRKPKIVKTRQRGTVMYSIDKPGFFLRDVNTVIIQANGKQPRLVTRKENNTWFVTYTSNGCTDSSLALTITDNAGRETRFVDVPI
jgi:hypothetical protein